jgi:hypothetical protein
MGKQQTKKKTQAWRHNPIRVPDAHIGAGKGEGKADPGKEKQMLPILKKVSFRIPGSLERRTTSCSSLLWRSLIWSPALPHALQKRERGSGVIDWWPAFVTARSLKS